MWRIIAFLAVLLAAGAAQATCSAVPNSFTSGTIIQSGQVNANNTALVACINGIDTGQITTGNLANARLQNSGVTTIFGVSCTLGGTCGASTLTNSLGGNVALSNTGTFFDGPSVAQGTSGTWCAVGTVSVQDTVGIAGMSAKLWDGTTVIASAQATTPAASASFPIALSGCIVTPAGNIRISVKDGSSTNGLITNNSSSQGKDSTITVWRVN